MQKNWAAKTLWILTCPLKSFCVTWFCFILQEFLSIKVNNINIKTTQIIFLRVCVHVGRCNDENRKQQRKKALQPDLIALLLVYVCWAHMLY